MTTLANYGNSGNRRSRAQVYLRLMRMDKPIGTLLLLWPTYWALWLAAEGMPDWHLLLLFTAGTFLMRSAGCVMNDFADRDFDGAVERTRDRPFARGEVSKKEALVLCAVLCFFSALCLIPMNRLAWLMSIPAVVIALTYPFFKRFFPIPQLYLGFAFGFGIPMAFAAQAGALPWTMWLLFAANVCWTIAYDTAYAMADKPDDLKIGIHSSAITFGRYDAQWVMFFHALFLAGLAWVGARMQMSSPFWAAWAVSAFFIVRQYPLIKTRDRQKCFAVFMANNRIGAIIFSGIVLHYLLQAA